MIVYSTEHCPQCRLLKQRLTAANINFESCTDEELMRQKGISTIPIIELQDGTFMNFAQALAALNKGELR